MIRDSVFFFYPKLKIASNRCKDMQAGTLSTATSNNN